MCELREYHEARHKTALFFYEILLVRGTGRPISLQELSCLFGTKQFTDDMRQIVGHSQKGLRKFLLQFPSIFTLDGETVLLNVNLDAYSPQNKATTTGEFGGNTRYTLLPFENGDDFANHLSAAVVRLKAIEYFANKLSQYGPKIAVPLRNLFGYRSQASFAIRRMLGQSYRTFCDLFEQNTDCFAFDAEHETVTLHWTFYDTCARPLAFETDRFAFFVRVLVRALQNNRSRLMLRLQPPTDIETLHDSFRKAVQNDRCFETVAQFEFFLQLFPDFFHVCDRKVSLKISDDRSQTENTGNARKTTVEPQSKVQKEGTSVAATTAKQIDQKASLKSRVNSLLMKTLQENTKTTNKIEVKSNGTNCTTTVAHHELVCTIKDGKRIVNELIASAQKVEESVSFYDVRKMAFVLDVKGITVGRLQGKLTLMQVRKFDTKETFIFDLLMCCELATLLKDFLESEDVIKVCLDAKSLAFNLLNQFGISVKCLFDLQVAHAVFMHDVSSGRPFKKVQSITLPSLCDLYDIKSLDLTRRAQIRQASKADKFFWIKRPITGDKVDFLLDELRAVAEVYAKMRQLMANTSCEAQKQQQQLLIVLNAEQTSALIRPQDVQLAKKARKIDYELFDLRAKFAGGGDDEKLVLSNREIKLLKYIELTDTEKNRIKTSEKVVRKLERIRTDAAISDPEDESMVGGELLSDDAELSDALSDESDVKTAAAVAADDENDSLASSSEPTSLAESMQLVEMVLKDQTIAKVEKIDKLESLLSFAEQFTRSPIRSSVNGGSRDRKSKTGQCKCKCHQSNDFVENGRLSSEMRECAHREVQTMSTGDIVAIKVFLN